jgi:hypothetical protein
LIPGDSRLALILMALEPGERAVVLALGRQGIGSWTEAAEFIGSGDPSFGERVRGKARRPAAEQRGRNAQRCTDQSTGLWQPEQEGEKA